MKFQKKLPIIFPSAIALFATTSAFAATDLTAITGAFTAADIVTGAVYVAIKAAKIVIGMLRGG
jgi:hypothetical protein